MLSRNSTWLKQSLCFYKYRSMSDKSSENPSTYKVQHDQTDKVFFIDLPEGHKAILEYQHLDPKVLDLYHTYVPESCRGKGLAQILAKAALDYVVTNDYQMKLTCTYLSDYVKKYHQPQYTSRLLQ